MSPDAENTWQHVSACYLQSRQRFRRTRLERDSSVKPWAEWNSGWSATVWLLDAHVFINPDSNLTQQKWQNLHRDRNYECFRFEFWGLLSSLLMVQWLYPCLVGIYGRYCLIFSRLSYVSTNSFADLLFWHRNGSVWIDLLFNSLYPSGNGSVIIARNIGILSYIAAPFWIVKIM